MNPHSWPVAAIAILVAGAVIPLRAAPAPVSSSLGTLIGQARISPGPWAANELFGRYQTFDVSSWTSGYAGRLERRPGGMGSDYDIVDRTFQRTGSIEYFGNKFTLYTPHHQVVGYLDGWGGFAGEYRILDATNREVGKLVPAYPDGQTWNVDGDAQTAALFAKVGILLDRHGRSVTPREARRLAAFDLLDTRR